MEGSTERRLEERLAVDDEARELCEKSKATIMKNWNCEPGGILSPERYPEDRALSSEVLKGLAGLSVLVTLAEGRQLLLKEINTRIYGPKPKAGFRYTKHLTLSDVSKANDKTRNMKPQQAMYATTDNQPKKLETSTSMKSANRKRRRSSISIDSGSLNDVPRGLSETLPDKTPEAMLEGTQAKSLCTTLLKTPYKEQQSHLNRLQNVSPQPFSDKMTRASAIRTNDQQNVTLLGQGSMRADDEFSDFQTDSESHDQEEIISGEEFVGHQNESNAHHCGEKTANERLVGHSKWSAPKKQQDETAVTRSEDLQDVTLPPGTVIQKALSQTNERSAIGSLQSSRWVSTTTIECLLWTFRTDDFCILDPQMFDFHNPTLCRAVNRLPQQSKILLPLFSNSHWALAIFFTAEQSIHYYDSLPGGDISVTRQTLLEFATPFHPSLSRWKFQATLGNTQTKSYDCGVYIIVVALHLFANIEITDSTRIDFQLWTSLLQALRSEESTGSRYAEEYGTEIEENDGSHSSSTPHPVKKPTDTCDSIELETYHIDALTDTLKEAHSGKYQAVVESARETGISADDAIKVISALQESLSYALVQVRSAITQCEADTAKVETIIGDYRSIQNIFHDVKVVDNLRHSQTDIAKLHRCYSEKMKILQQKMHALKAAEKITMRAGEKARTVQIAAIGIWKTSLVLDSLEEMRETLDGWKEELNDIS